MTSIKTFYAFVFLQVIIVGCSSNKKLAKLKDEKIQLIEKKKMNFNTLSTLYSSSEALVLQVHPEIEDGQTIINGIIASEVSSTIFIPSRLGNTFSCPLKYFQANASLPEKWILNDSFQRMELSNVKNLKKIVITRKVNGKEEEINLPFAFSTRLLDYFSLDICHNIQNYQGFDCYAFVSLLTDVKYFPPNPEFDYKKTKTLNVGDIVTLAIDSKLPDSIIHWALYLGDDLYISKFGQSGKGAQSRVTVMNLENMMKLYNCKLAYKAIPKPNAKHWNGYKI